MSTVSVIIPFFNASQYVTPCIESMCRQTIQEQIELVLVDDGSTDNSLTLIKQTLTNKGFKGSVQTICHEKNLGVAEARKNGILASTGDYIIFCDSDDWVDDRMYELLLEKAENEDSNIVICDFNNIYSNKPSYISSQGITSDLLQGLLLCKCSGSLWNKLVKSNLYKNNITYPSHDFCEDFAYSAQLAIKTQKISYLNKALYMYVHRDGSIVQDRSTSSILKRLDDNLENLYLVEKALDDAGLRDNYKSELIALRMIVKNSIRPYIHRHGFYKRWLSIFPELTIDIFKSRHVSWRSRIAYFATMAGIYPFTK